MLTNRGLRTHPAVDEFGWRRGWWARSSVVLRPQDHEVVRGALHPVIDAVDAVVREPVIEQLRVLAWCRHRSIHVPLPKQRAPVVVTAVNVWPTELDVWLTGAAACTCRSERCVMRVDPVASECDELRWPLAATTSTASEGAQDTISSPPSPSGLKVPDLLASELRWSLTRE